MRLLHNCWNLNETGKIKDNLLDSTAILGYMQTVTTGNDETSDILRIMQQSKHVYYATSSNYNKRRNFANKYGFVVAASRYQVNEAVKNLMPNLRQEEIVNLAFSLI